MPIGKVWLVGAGPGDAGLLTLRGREVMERADAIVFDRLVGDGVLAMMPERAEKINVGKEGGRHPVPQREIEKILVEKALEGKNVVRLKGGDPFVFGRGGEEIEALKKENIEFEVVPGVTSAIAAPSAAGIPVTHRGLAASLHIITAHTKEGGIADTDYAALARLGGTLLFLMGASALPDICAALTKAGMSPDTPAAAVERGTTARQRRIEGTLGTLTEIAKREELRSPAVIIVGAVAALGKEFEWKKFLPLSGRKLIVTRPRGRAGKLSAKLRGLGAEVVECPCISTRTLDVKLPQLSGWSWIGFTSATGVEAFFELLAKEGRDVRETGGAKIAAIGKATMEALRARGLSVDYVPEVYDGASLADGLAPLAAGGKVLMLRAKDGSPELTEHLRAAGADFTEFALYETTYEKPAVLPDGADAALFTSASTVRGFAAAFGGPVVKTACCIGRQTAEEAAKHGFEEIRTAEKATLDSLIKTLEVDGK